MQILNPPSAESSDNTLSPPFEEGNALEVVPSGVSTVATTEPQEDTPGIITVADIPKGFNRPPNLRVLQRLIDVDDIPSS